MRRDLRRIDVETLTALVGTFAADAESLARASADSLPVTDDWPVMEYSVRSRLFETRLPAGLFDVSRVDRWCPSCFRDGVPRRTLAQLPGYLAALGSWYADERFLVHASRESARFRAAAEAPADPAVRAAVRGSRYLSGFLRIPDESVAVSRLSRP